VAHFSSSHSPTAQEWQAADDVLPSGDVVMAGQLSQLDEPDAFVYVPDVQREHSVTVFVRSMPRFISLAIKEAASVLKYSSTTKRPAMSPLKYSS